VRMWQGVGSTSCQSSSLLHKGQFSSFLPISY
jgi:hypothetical protein